MPGRFFLGVGTGENLNEHIIGRGGPSPDVRLEMLEEAIDVIRLLWKGGTRSHRGRHYTVEDARLYTLPPESPPLMVAASKPRAAELAGRLGDAIINTDVDRALLERFAGAGGKDKPRYLELGVCWGKSERQARRTAHEIWPLSALEGPLFTELAQPSHFEAAFKPITEKQVAEAVICGPDLGRHVEAIRKAARAGYTHVCVHQIGPAQEGFLDAYARDVLPRFGVRRALHAVPRPAARIERPSGQTSARPARRGRR
jgi:G6PDH family F420-dependent oxidoreductase